MIGVHQLEVSGIQLGLYFAKSIVDTCQLIDLAVSIRAHMYDAMGTFHGSSIDQYLV